MKSISEIAKEKHRSFGTRLIFSVLCSLLLTVFVDYVISEAIVFWYMHHYGIAVRAELSEDMGFAMLVGFYFLLFTPVSLIVSLFICWKKFK